MSEDTKKTSDNKVKVFSKPPMTVLKGIGEKRVSQFARLNIHTPRDLLTFFPKSYEDWSQVSEIRSSVLGETQCFKVRAVTLPREHFIRKGMVLYKFKVADDSGTMDITLFNNKFAADKIKKDTDFLFYGQVSGNFTGREMTSPQIELASGGIRIKPIYPQTEGLSTRIIENCVAQSLKMFAYELENDPLPQDVINKLSLISRQEALNNIHFPQSNELLEKARLRLAYEELLVLQLGLLQLRGRSKSENGIIVKAHYKNDFEKLLPFQLTKAQSRTIDECLLDISGQSPMNRLVQGDVGSGKTAVAAAVAHTVIKNGYQAALMAPTEILAEQHFLSLSKMLAPADINVELLTGSMNQSVKRNIYERLASGEINLIVGTHALISKNVAFSSLGLVVTDEQHRFGVKQRAELASKASAADPDNPLAFMPHTLVMSATPIPRTLALIVYGDLDVSVLDELPPGRTPVETYAVGSDKRERVYNYVKKHIAKGLQSYIVCPLVEDPNQESDLVSATEYAQKLLAGPFKGYKLGLLHGKMKSDDKEKIMSAFKSNEISILVSTTVIEVGVDVPNAAIIVIENAERFGLAQLHQLRGRVGRGKEASTCVLISDAQNEEAVRRLKVMSSTNDGFKIADEDLKLRGPGDFFGRRQHGLPDLKIANLTGGDLPLMHNAQTDAREILAADPDLILDENRLLGRYVADLFDSIGEQGLN